MPYISILSQGVSSEMEAPRLLSASDDAVTELILVLIGPGLPSEADVSIITRISYTSSCFVHRPIMLTSYSASCAVDVIPQYLMFFLTMTPRLFFLGMLSCN